MLSLRELQLRFDAALFEAASDASTPWVCGDESAVAARIGIYRNNLREGFIKALAIEFPVIERLVGKECFRQLALKLLEQHPSREGDLHHIGRPFPDLLRLEFGRAQYAYLAEVADLEWAYQQSLIAADTEPFDLETLRDVSTENYPKLRFSLHPACRLVRSAYPVVRIWMSNQPDAVEEETIDLDAGADLVLVRRTAEGVEFRRLTGADFAMLEALARAVSLEAALEAAYTSDPEFDLAQALRRYVALGVLTGLRRDATTLLKGMPQ